MDGSLRSSAFKLDEVRASSGPDGESLRSFESMEEPSSASSMSRPSISAFKGATLGVQGYWTWTMRQAAFRTRLGTNLAWRTDWGGSRVEAGAVRKRKRTVEEKGGQRRSGGGQRRRGGGSMRREGEAAQREGQWASAGYREGEKIAFKT
jgi:hypothetical protein